MDKLDEKDTQSNTETGVQATNAVDVKECFRWLRRDALKVCTQLDIKLYRKGEQKRRKSMEDTKKMLRIL